MESTVESGPDIQKDLITHPTLYQNETGISVDTSNPTTAAIEKLIHENGSKIPYSAFMGECLYGENGYYNAGKVDIGETGDFITSPEASPFFGASIARGCMLMWEKMGKPSNFRVVEMGAGKGTMALSFLQWSKDHYPDFFNSVRYTIVEYAQELIPQQKARIGEVAQIDWIRGSAYNIPLGDVEGIFISNELPDAFPIERVKKNEWTT